MKRQRIMITRDAELRDAGGIAKVHVRSWQAAHAGIVPDEDLAQSFGRPARTVLGANPLKRRTRNFRFSESKSRSGMVGFWALARRRLRSNPGCRAARHLFTSGVLEHGLWQTALQSHRNSDSPKLGREP